MQAPHPTTRTWRFPDSEPPGVVNLRTLMAAPDRLEHQLVVVARAGDAQLECATASEPLAFAHGNISDEYALMLPTGDALLDSFQARTFLADPATGDDVARMKHGCGDLVFQPHGLLHWPGRLRPPFETFDFAPGMRRRGLTVVACCSRPRPPPAPRPGGVTRLASAPAGIVAELGDASLELLHAPAAVAPPRGGFLLVLEAEPSAGCFPCDLVFVPPGGSLATPGVTRALLFSSSLSVAEPPPAIPSPPFPPFEEAPPGTLPQRVGELVLDEIDARDVSVSVGGNPPGRVPRLWLARMLFRLALHGLRLGYLETYGGFYSDDRGSDLLLGMRGHGHIALPRAQAATIVERLYRAVAPPEYLERLS